MIDALLALPPHMRDRLASALETGLVAPPCSIGALRAALGTRDIGDGLLAAVSQMDRAGLSGSSAAIVVRTISEVSRRSTKPDIVWSGPDLPGVHARDTRRVFEELLGTAERAIWASTYAFFDGPKVFDVLCRRMDARPKLQVTLLLNIARKQGDTTTGEQLVRRFADRF